jgi:hypothetical protein
MSVFSPCEGSTSMLVESKESEAGRHSTSQGTFTSLGVKGGTDGVLAFVIALDQEGPSVDDDGCAVEVNVRFDKVEFQPGKDMPSELSGHKALGLFFPTTLTIQIAENVFLIWWYDTFHICNIIMTAPPKIALGHTITLSSC